MFGLKKARLSGLGEKIRFGAGVAFILGMFIIAMALQSGKGQKEPLSVPALTAQVIDQTGTLKQPELQQLQAKLAAFEHDKGSQIVILMVGSTQPEEIAAYANRVADTWKIGRRDIGDGIVVVVAKDVRRMRIEVARALEGALPDIEAARIIDHDMKPNFKAGDFGKGLSAAADSIIARISAESLPEHNKVQQNLPAVSPPLAAPSAAPSAAASDAAVAKNDVRQTSESANKLFMMAMVVAGVAAAIAIWRQSRDKKWSFLILLPVAAGLIVLAGIWILPKEEIGEIGTAISMYTILYPIWKWFIKYVINMFSFSSSAGSSSYSDDDDDSSSSSGSSSGGYSSGGGGSYGGGGASGNW